MPSSERDPAMFDKRDSARLGTAGAGGKNRSYRPKPGLPPANGKDRRQGSIVHSGIGQQSQPFSVDDRPRHGRGPRIRARLHARSAPGTLAVGRTDIGSVAARGTGVAVSRLDDHRRLLPLPLRAGTGRRRVRASRSCRRTHNGCRQRRAGRRAL